MPLMSFKIIFGTLLIMGVGFAIIQNPADHTEEQTAAPEVNQHSSTHSPPWCVCVFIKVQFICNVVLVSGVQECESVILFQILSPQSLLQNIEYSSYAIQQVLNSYLIYIQQCVYVDLKLTAYPFPTLPFGNRSFVFYVCQSVLFWKSVHVYHFQVLHISDIIG